MNSLAGGTSRLSRYQPLLKDKIGDGRVIGTPRDRRWPLCVPSQLGKCLNYAVEVSINDNGQPYATRC